jgi:hypothetical protein
MVRKCSSLNYIENKSMQNGVEEVFEFKKRSKLGSDPDNTCDLQQVALA